MSAVAGDLLVAVDLQVVFADPASPWATPGFESLVEPVGALADAFGERAVFTRFTLPPGAPPGSWGAYYERWDTVAALGPEWFALAEPWTGRPSLARPSFSKWDNELRGLAGEGAVVLCGVATDCCVLATALGAIDAGVPVRLVTDACRGADAAAHERAVALLAAFAPQVALTTVAAELARAPATRG